MSKYAFAAAAALSALIASSAAMAGSESAPAFNVSVTVEAGCTLGTVSGDVPFASTPGTALTAPGVQSNSVGITCTSSTPYKVSLTSTNGFAMKKSGVTGAGIGYSVSTGPVGGKTYLSTSGITYDSVGTGAEKILTLDYNITSGWAATNAPGSYTDQVTLNLSF